MESILTSLLNKFNLLDFFAGSSSGRTPGSGPGSRGSNPCPAAKEPICWIAGVLPKHQGHGFASIPAGELLSRIIFEICARSSTG